jgi:hypothetical protein
MRFGGVFNWSWASLPHPLLFVPRDTAIRFYGLSPRSKSAAAIAKRGVIVPAIIALLDIPRRRSPFFNPPRKGGRNHTLTNECRLTLTGV